MTWAWSRWPWRCRCRAQPLGQPWPICLGRRRNYRRIATTPRRVALPLVHPSRRLLHEVERLVIEVSEVTERIDNAFKVTDDVYWNRLYSALLVVLQVRIWRDGVNQKLALLRETYGMLHDEADTERANALEWAVLLLIL